jgi:hypothetical protein
MYAEVAKNDRTFMGSLEIMFAALITLGPFALLLWMIGQRGGDD